MLLLIICLLPTGLAAQSYAERYEKCAERLKTASSDSVYMLRLMEKDSCLTGTLAPNFKAKDIYGRWIELAQLKGKVVVLHFWGTHCGPCVDEIPMLNRLVKHYVGKQVAFIGLASDKKVALLRFFKKQPFRFAHIADTKKTATEVFKITDVMPYTFVIAPNGKIYKIVMGSIVEDGFNFYKNLLDECLSK